MGNSVAALRDPSGKEATEPHGPIMSESAKELVRILPYRLDLLKSIAKNTGKVERFGVIMKSVNPKTWPRYKFVELISKDATERRSPFKWWRSKPAPDGKNKMRGAQMLKSNPDGKVDIDKDEVTPGDLDRDYVIEFDWHTHPRTGDPLRWRQFDGQSECLRWLGKVKLLGGSEYRCLFSVPCGMGASPAVDPGDFAVEGAA